jgi:V-type H+-transporting ATPase 16kDa proteolipid subunit
MSGIIAVYGLVMAVLIAGSLNPLDDYSLYKYILPLLILTCSGIIHLSSGLCVGLTGLAAGYCIGIVGDQGVRSYLLEQKIFVGLVLILIFAEVLGLYGLIVGLILNTRAGPAQC